MLARVHFIVRSPTGRADPRGRRRPRSTEQLADATRLWDDDFAWCCERKLGDEAGGRLVRRGTATRSRRATRRTCTADEAVEGPRQLELLDRASRASSGMHSTSRAAGAGRAAVQGLPSRADVAVRRAAGAALARRRGRRRAAVRGHAAATAPSTCTTSACALPAPRVGRRRLPEVRRARFAERLRGRLARRGRGDGFNELVLRAGLTWRQVVVLRAYAKYLRQAGTTFSQEYMESTFIAYPRDRRGCWSRCSRRGSTPSSACGRGAASAARRPSELVEAISRGAGRGDSLDQDRILRSYLDADPGDPADQLLPAPGGRRPKAYVASSWTRRRSPTCPRPGRSTRSSCTRPGSRACTCGSARWPAAACAGRDRREDFRTEMLGLVKAQMVKNAVIVPVGAKGGFVAKQLPDPPSTGTRGWPRASPATSCSSPACSTSPTTSCGGKIVPPPRRGPPRRRRPVPGGGGRQGHRDVLRHRQRDLAGVRVLARRRVRLRRLGRLRPQGDGHHRPRRVGVGQAALPRPGPRHPDRRTSPWSASATCPATCSATGCCSPSTSGWSPRSTTGTSSSTRPGRGDVRSPSGSGCSTCRARPGTTTTASLISRRRRRLPAYGQVDADLAGGARGARAAPRHVAR